MRALLFVPGAQTEKDVAVAVGEHELGDVFPAANFNTAPCVGPGGVSGTIGAYGRAVYISDEQAWTSCAEGAYWIGVWESERPLPLDLEREALIGGHGVRLADGNDWLVPVARRFPSGTQLEQCVTFGDGGGVEFEIIESQRHLYEVASRVYDSLVADGTFSLEDTEVAEIAVEALSVNYRLNRVLAANVLRLFTTTNLSEILFALVDWPVLMKMVESLESENMLSRDAKKNGEAPVSRSGETGGADLSEDTRQVSRTSS